MRSKPGVSRIPLTRPADGPRGFLVYRVQGAEQRRPAGCWGSRGRFDANFAGFRHWCARRFRCPSRRHGTAEERGRHQEEDAQKLPKKAMSHGLKIALCVLKILTKKEPKTLQRKTLLPLREATLRGRTKIMKAWDTLVVINILTARLP